MSDVINDIVQRIRADRAKRQDTRIAFNESHIVLNFLEKMQRLESENAELTMNARQLELTLFTVVRNFKVLPVGLELGKTQKEITDMTFETIEKIKQSINYNAVEQLIKESKDD